MHALLCGIGVSLLSFEFDESTKGFERGEELNIVDQQIKFAGDYVEGHSLVRDQDIMRDVLVNKIVQNYSCCVR